MRRSYLLMVVLLTCVLGCASLESIFEHEDETEVPLADVPVAAIQAAQNAVPGITLTEASVEEEDGQTVYDLEGTANGTEYEIEVTAAGKVLEVEEDADTDDDHDDDDDDRHEDKEKDD